MDYIVRMEKEHNDLVRKIDKLNNIIKDTHKNSDSTELLPIIQQRAIWNPINICLVRGYLIAKKSKTGLMKKREN